MFVGAFALLLSTASARATPRAESKASISLPLIYPFDGYPKVLSTLYVGTPPQGPIQAVMDFGSANFWMFEKNATINWGSRYLGENGQCNITATPFYDQEASSSSTGLAAAGHQYSYGGNAKMIRALETINDTISFGTADSSTSSVSNVQFALGDFARMKVYATDCSSGVDYDPSILGLSAYVSDTEGPSFRQNLLDQGQIASPIISMWFDSAPDDIRSNFTGTALFGTLPPSDKYSGDLVKVAPNPPSNSIGYYVSTPTWTFGSRQIKTYIAAEQCLLDSGSGQDYLPLDRDDFLNATGLLYEAGTVVYPGACDSIPRNLTMGITFAGQENGTSVTVDVPIRNWARGNTDTADRCGLSLQLNEPGDCTLASPFFSAATLVFDDENNEIMIAQGGVATA